MTQPTRSELLDLSELVRTAEPGTGTLDFRVREMFLRIDPDYSGQRPTQSIDDAIATIPPLLGWVCAFGVERDGKTMFGAIITSPIDPNVVYSEAEAAGAAQALCVAALRLHMNFAVIGQRPIARA